MAKGIILFDIDRTIFDTDGMITILDFLINKILGNKDLTEIKNVEINYFKTLSNDRYFIPEHYIKSLCQRFNFKDEESIQDIFYDKKYEYIYKNNVFNETKIVLEKLKDKFDFGIFSEGTTKFQNHKFKSLNLNKYFKQDLIFIVDAKDTEKVVKQLPQGSIVVDDKESICNFLAENKIECIRINRKDRTKSDKYKTIYSLLELPAIL